LFVNGNEVDFAKIVGMNTKSVAKLEIMDLNDEKNKIMIELKK
jgi:hypothetical protein